MHVLGAHSGESTHGTARHCTLTDTRTFLQATISARERKRNRNDQALVQTNEVTAYTIGCRIFSTLLHSVSLYAQLVACVSNECRAEQQSETMLYKKHCNVALGRGTAGNRPECTAHTRVLMERESAADIHKTLSLLTPVSSL